MKKQPSPSREINRRIHRKSFQQAMQLHQQDKLDQAELCYMAILTAQPNHFDARHLLGVLRFQQGLYTEALDHIGAALQMKPNSVSALSNLSVVLRTLGQNERALASCDKALAIKPDYAEALNNRGLTSLLTGDFLSGWADYERRWDRKGASQRKLIAPYPAWKGEDIRGKSIIVYEEQGLGDVIQFTRYLLRLNLLGARVTFLIRSDMHRLLQPFASMIRLTDKVCPGDTFDFQCALLSLPVAFRTTLDTVPSDVRYLVSEAPLTARWRQYIGG